MAEDEKSINALIFVMLRGENACRKKNLTLHLALVGECDNENEHLRINPDYPAAQRPAR